MSHRNTCRGHLQAGKSSGRWQKGPLNVQNKRAPVCAGQQTAKARVAWRSPFAAFFLNLLSHNLFLHNCCVSFYNPACGRQHYGNCIFHPKYFLSTQFWWYTTLVPIFKKDHFQSSHPGHLPQAFPLLLSRFCPSWLRRYFQRWEAASILFPLLRQK